MRSHRLVAIFSSLVLFAAAAPAFAEGPAEAVVDGTEPSAAAKQEAARRFEHAIKLYEDADYALALAEFERVYELVPDYRVLYNIGQVNVQLGRYARALRALKDYETRGGGELSAERRKSVQSDLELLAGKVATVTISVDQPGADIAVDGVTIGKSPLNGEVIVDVGERSLQVSLAGYKPRTQVLSLAGGDHRDMRFLLEVDSGSSTTTPTTTSEPRALPPRQPVKLAPAPASPSRAWIGWTITGALATGGIVAGALGASAAKDLDDLRGTPGTTRGDLNDARDRARSRLLVADVLAASAIVAGGATLYFQLSSKHATTDARGSAPLQVALSPSQVSLVWRN